MSKRLFGLKSKLRKMFWVDSWAIGIVHEPIYTFLDPEASHHICWVPLQRKGTFAADPFATAEDGRICILFEEFDFKKDKGVIAGLELDTSLVSPRFHRVLDSECHVSYPYLIEHEDALYMIPETSADREIVLLKSERLPDLWEKVGVLLKDVAAVDSTVFKYDGRWWIAFTDGDNGPNSLLHIWHAPDLFGPWEAHAANPVKNDVFSSRPGGTPFEHDGILYRPAQDCSCTYGGSIVINRVLKLTPTEFEEEIVTRIRPQKDGIYPDGLHTISSAGGITLIDGKRFMFSPVALKVALAKKTSSLVSRRKAA